MTLGQFGILAYVWIGVAVITFLILVLTKIRAPYGRHASTGWGPMISNRWGWFWMELPAFLLFPLLVLLGPREKDLLSWFLVGLWSLHYFNRTVIFPFRLRTIGKRMPVLIVGSALFFNGMNGLLNGFYLGYVAPADAGPYSINVLIGTLIFFLGFIINQVADTKLINLRKTSNGYQVPRKWLFEYVSCPNHFGEILEWTGFAIVAWSLPACSFAIWTFCNLVPRALNHHDWYREKFPAYPTKRKAVIPFLW
jgi:3-oxo-5-alpha-steroid 4-dehydrogenase 1